MTKTFFPDPSDTAAPVPAPRASTVSAVSRPRLSRGNRLLLALICFNLACLAYYLFYGYQFRFHSDSAVANLLAQEMHDSGQYFPDDWNYVFGDLWVLSTHTWVALLLPLFPNGFALHGAGAVIGCLITGIVTWGTCTILGASLRMRLAALALLSAGFTPSMSEHIYGQQAYGTSYYLSCAMLVCGWKFLHAANAVRWRWAAALAAMSVLVIWPNPQRGLVYFLFPLAAGVVAAYATGRRNALPGTPPLARIGALAALAVAGIVAGFLLHRSTLAHSAGMAPSFTVAWTDFPTMVANVMRTVHGLVGTLGGVPVPGTPVASAMGLVSAVKFVAGLALVALLPLAVSRLLRSRHPGRAFVAAAAAASFGASFFLFTTSTLALAGPDEELVRYMVPGAMLAVLALVAWLVDRADSGPGPVARTAGLAAIGLAMLSAPLAFGVADLAAIQRAGGIEQANHRVRLARFLEAQGLRYGYATFWNAGQLTVLSNSAVKVRQVQFANGLPLPMRHLSSNRWYRSSAWQGPSFILLADGEAPSLDLQRMSELSGQPVKRLAFEGYQVLVFDHNIADDFADWSDEIVKPLQYRPTSASLHPIGQFVPEQRVLTANKGEAGALHYGPYRRLPAGRYRVSFDLAVDDATAEDVGSVDVTGDGGKQVFAKKAIGQAGRQQIVLPVILDKAATGVEFRVFSAGTARLTLMNIELANE